MEFFKFFPSVSDAKLYYKHYDENGNYLSSGVVAMSSDIVIEDVYHYTPAGFYKEVKNGDNTDLVVVPFYFYFDISKIAPNDSSDFVVSIEEDFVIVSYKGSVVFKKPLFFYFKDGVLNLNSSFSSDVEGSDASYSISMRVDVENRSFYFYFAKDGKLVSVSVDLQNFANSDLFLKNVILNKLNDLDCGGGSVDLTPVENSLNNISQKVDVLNIVDISNKIDEKLSQIFNLQSLNGSNGSKFKDGEEVTLKGYTGNWSVGGSYSLLNNDGVTIIIYKLIQGDRVVLAPAPFVGV